MFVFHSSRFISFFAPLKGRPLVIVISRSDWTPFGLIYYLFSPHKEVTLRGWNGANWIQSRKKVGRYIWLLRRTFSYLWFAKRRAWKEHLELVLLCYLIVELSHIEDLSIRENEKNKKKVWLEGGIGCSMAIWKIHLINNDINALAPITFFAFPPMQWMHRWKVDFDENVDQKYIWRETILQLSAGSLQSCHRCSQLTPGMAY